MRRFVQADIVLYLFLLLLGIGGFFVAVAWPQAEGYYAFIILAALGGIGVTSYIFYAKRFREHLACPMGSNCNVVVNSRYSKFLGISLEYLGFLYYLALVASYGLLFAFPYLRETFFSTGVLLLTTAAFGFSIYLVFVQAFLLRQWCIWCLLSATLSTIIFIVSLTSLPLASAFLQGASGFFVLLQTLGFIVGIGAVTASFALFFKYLENDLDIDDMEANTLHNLSEFGWLGFGITFIATYALYAGDPVVFTASPILLIQVIALSVVFLSGAVFNTLFAPTISVLPFYEKKRTLEKPSLLRSLRKATFITAGVSLSSWYFALAVHYMNEYSFKMFLLLYVGVLVVSVVVSLLINQALR